MKIIRFVGRDFYAFGAVDATWVASGYRNVRYRQIRLDDSYKVNPFTRETKLIETIILHSMISISKNEYSQEDYEKFMMAAIRWYTNF